MNRYFTILFLLLSSSLLPAEETILWLPFGEAEEEIGLYSEDGEEWFPVLFALDQTGAVHVPDFFKGRVAVYDRNGTFVRGIPAPDLVSPRMNLFRIAPDGTYYSFVDFAFVSADAEGKVKWTLPFPIGTIPQGAVATDDAVYLAVEAEGGQVAVRVPYGDTIPEVSIVSRALAGGKTAAARNAAGYEVSFRLADELAAGGPIAGLLREDAVEFYDLAYLGSDGRTVWVGYSSEGYQLITVTKDRRVIDRFILEKRYLSGTRGLRPYYVASPELVGQSGGSARLGLGIVTMERPKR